MALDGLAILAAGLIGFSESIAFSNLYRAGILMSVALLLLLFVLRVAYSIVCLLLIAVISFGVFVNRLPAEYRDPRNEGLCSKVLGTHAPRWVAGFIHLFGFWYLSVCILWGVLDVYKEDLFYSEELGHQLAATSYMGAFVVTPLLLMPPGYEKGELKHQLYESVVIVFASIIYYLCFRIAHIVEGRNPPNLTAPDWDHELIGLFWCFSGIHGIVSALAGCKTSAHVVFPAGYVYYSFVNHTDLYPEYFSGSWLQTWIAPHQVHAFCFGVGAVCRLLNCIRESVYFFFLGIVAWSFSTKDVALRMHSIFTFDHNKESGWSEECDPDCVVNYPTHHVVRQVVLLLGAALFPIHFMVLRRLRKFVDQWSRVLRPTTHISANDSDDPEWKTELLSCESTEETLDDTSDRSW